MPPPPAVPSADMSFLLISRERKFWLIDATRWVFSAYHSTETQVSRASLVHANVALNVSLQNRFSFTWKCWCHLTCFFWGSMCVWLCWDLATSVLFITPAKEVLFYHLCVCVCVFLFGLSFMQKLLALHSISYKTWVATWMRSLKILEMNQ